MRVAVIGAGYWGPKHIRIFERRPDCTLATVCDQDPQRLEHARQIAPHTQTTTSADDVLADPDIDAVVIATPVSTHATLAERALREGKHVLVEKPMAASSADAAMLSTLAHEHGRVLAVGHVYLYHAAYRELQRTISQGAIGELAYVSTSRGNVGPPHAEVDVIWDLAVHDLAMTFDLIDSPPAEVAAHGRRYIHPEHNDAAMIVVTYADGRMSYHTVSWLSPDKLRSFHVAGTAGYAIFDETQPAPLTIYGPHVDNRLDASASTGELSFGPGEVVRPEIEPIDALEAECAAFLEAVRGGDPVPGDARSGLSVVRVLEAASAALQRGAPVELSDLDERSEARA